MKSLKGFFVICALSVILNGCRYNVEMPDLNPAPPPEPLAIPAPKIELKRDAELERQFAEIAEDAKGNVGVAAVVLETGDAALLNENEHYPMQSVYKLPISMAIMDQIRRGEHDLDEKIGVTREDFVREGQRSPLRDQNPNGAEFTIRELIRLALIESDGTASDVLIRVAGGAEELQSYLTQIGIPEMKVVNTEKEMGRDWDLQYRNWSTPPAAVNLLQFICADAKGFGGDGVETAPGICGCGNSEELLQFMLRSNPGAKRLKGHLPKDTSVAHKTGTGGNQNGITSATNDIGIIYLPESGHHLAMAVFVSDSPADEKTREAVIATIAKAAWDKWH